MAKHKKRAPPREEEDSEDFDEELSGMEEEDEDDQPGPSGRRPGGEPREAIYNVDGLHEKLEDIGWTAEQDWEESLVINSEQATTITNVEDDLARELAFYNQALGAAQQAIKRFDAAGLPWLRPTDYYAEMVKSDEHMAKVKEQLMFEQRQIEQTEERRKQREQKMYGKQVQLEKTKERTSDKKRQIEQISKLRKQRVNSGFAGELDMDEQLEKMESGHSNRRQPLNLKQLANRGTPSSSSGKGPNKKRQARDSKFGFGGRKSLNKQNDAYSSADMSGDRPRKFQGGGRGGGRSGGRGGGRSGGRGGGGLGARGGVQKPSGGGGQQRPGKQRRQAMRGGGRGGGGRGGGGRGGGGRGGGRGGRR